MSAHYEGWGEHHAYKCGKDDGFIAGHYAAVQGCIAIVEAMLTAPILPSGLPQVVQLHDLIDALREVQA